MLRPWRFFHTKFIWRCWVPSNYFFYIPRNSIIAPFRPHNVYSEIYSFIPGPLCYNSHHWQRFSLIHTSSIMEKKRKTREEKKLPNIIQFKPKAKYPIIQLWSGITTKEFSKQADRSIGDVFEAMSYIDNSEPYRKSGAEIHDKLILQEIAKKLGNRVEFIGNPKYRKEKVEKVKDLFRSPPPNPEKLVKRPPIVTIMGHVDHGKTTLLDSLRHTSVAAQEHGLITQHIGAFTVKVQGELITFLDTPGHAAFHAMRARGAHATDIIVLVVAADDSVMEQTLESIKYANQANVPIIVAINKIDKPQADVMQVKKDLLSHGIQLEENGGDVQVVCISALKSRNLDHLTDGILTQAEVMEIGGDPEGLVEGVILESSVDPHRGKLSTALIQRGTLKKTDFLVAGTSWAKVRTLFDEGGKHVTAVGPGLPVQISGWKTLPSAGDLILEAESERHAQEVVRHRESLKMAEKMEMDGIVIQRKMEEYLEKYREARHQRLLRGRYRKERSYFREKEIVMDLSPCLSVILKGDVHGSIEAIVDVVATYKSHDVCRLDLVHFDVGNITENDIVLAEAFTGIIYGFNVNIPPSIKTLAEEKDVTIKFFNVIYHLVDDLKKEISSRLPLLKKEDEIGSAVVLQEFLINDGKNKVPVAGCKCTKGIVKKGSLCKLIRSDDVIYKGHVTSLKHEKTNVETIKKSIECGLRVEDTSVKFLPGDTIVCFSERFVTQETDWNPGF